MIDHDKFQQAVRTVCMQELAKAFREAFVYGPPVMGAIYKEYIDLCDAPVATVDTSTERVDETAKNEHERVIEEWMKPHPQCDAACLYACTEGFTTFPTCSTTKRNKRNKGNK